MPRSRSGLSLFLTTWTALLGLVLVSAPLVADGEAGRLPWRFDLTAMNTGSVGPRTARLDLRLTRWSTDEEREALFEALEQGSRRSLPDALKRQESVGRLREVRGTGEELRYSRRIPTAEGGEQIILATDRRIEFVEAWTASRTLDYNVSVIQLEIGPDGRGQGTLMVGAEITYDEAKNQVTIEHLAI